MCGIFGVISRNKNGMFNDELAFLRQAFIANSLRGEDSAGAFVVTKDKPNECNWVKKAGEPFHLLYSEEFKKLFELADKQGCVMVGHNRYATKGEVTTKNAHPFQEGPITLVHNGTIHNGLDYPQDVVVDSHALTHALATEGISIFERITGAFACVWHDARTGLLHIAKNYERPLAMIESMGTYFFASEAAMLVWLFQRNNGQYYQPRKFNTIEIKNNTLYSFNLTVDDPEPIAEPLPQKKYYPTTTYTRGGGTHGTSKHKPPTVPSKNSNLVTFEIKEIITNEGNSFPYFTYIGITDDMEGVYFNNNKLIEFDGKFFQGEIRTVEVGRFPDYGHNTPWYKLAPRTIIELEKGNQVGDNILTDSELQEALKKPCLCCDSPVKKDELDLMQALQVSNNKYRMICPSCTQEDMLNKLTNMYTTNAPIQ